MPKAYDDEELERLRNANEPDGGSTNGAFSLGPFHASLGELLGLISVLYFCSIAAFNAGYFSVVRGNFIEFFTLTDLLVTNIQIIQYFVIVYGIYALVVTYIAFLESIWPTGLSETVRNAIERFILYCHQTNIAWWSFFFALFLFLILSDYVFIIFHISSFTLLVIPTFVFQDGLFYFFWIGYKFKHATEKTMVFVALASVFLFAYGAGRAWIKSEIGSPNPQSIVDEKGNCLERHILRTANAGILFYNQTMRQFEFRSKESVRTVFENAACS